MSLSIIEKLFMFLSIGLCFYLVTIKTKLAWLWAYNFDSYPAENVRIGNFIGVEDQWWIFHINVIKFFSEENWDIQRRLIMILLQHQNFWVKWQTFYENVLLMYYAVHENTLYSTPVLQSGLLPDKCTTSLVRPTAGKCVWLILLVSKIGYYGVFYK